MPHDFARFLLNCIGLDSGNIDALPGSEARTFVHMTWNMYAQGILGDYLGD